MKNIDEILNAMQKSKFRSSFHLKEKDFEYIKSKGMGKIKEHAVDFVRNRLVDTSKITDGKQTPTKGHPVFVAQHATATCCRECLKKWHKIENTHILRAEEIDYVVDVIINWIYKEIEKQKNS